MKRLWNVLVLTLALNFLAMVGGVGYLYSAGRLDKEHLAAVRAALEPTPTTQPVEAVEVESPTTAPVNAVDEMEAALTAAAGRPGEAAGELSARRVAVESAAAALGRRRRELDDLQRLLATSRADLERQRAAVAAEKKQFDADRAADAALAADAGFQQTLKLYQSMQPKQVKAIFLATDDAAVARYLSAMPPRDVTKILREFKSPDETLRVKKVLDLMRQSAPVAAAE